MQKLLKYKKRIYNGWKADSKLNGMNSWRYWRYLRFYVTFSYNSALNQMVLTF